jgi:hypothetical protein
MRVGLVGCVKKKGPVAAPAAELYVSPLFVGRRRFVEAGCDRWFILSALHGLVDPDEVIEPYDESLVSAGVGERQAWAKGILASVDDLFGDVAGMVFEVHAGAAYRDFGLIEGLRRRGGAVVVPAAGLSQGRQLAFYAGTLVRRSDHPDPGIPPGPPSASPRQGSVGYSALARCLDGIEHRTVTLGFVDLEAVLGRGLPASARRHRPWWANSGSAQARSWVSAGWNVAAVDLAAERVTFQRVAT